MKEGVKNMSYESAYYLSVSSKSVGPIKYSKSSASIKYFKSAVSIKDTKQQIIIL